MTDLAVALFVAILVLAGLYVPRWGDAIGRLARRGDRAGAGAPPAAGDPPGDPAAARERRHGG